MYKMDFFVFLHLLPKSCKKIFLPSENKKRSNKTKKIYFVPKFTLNDQDSFKDFSDVWARKRAKVGMTVRDNSENILSW